MTPSYRADGAKSKGLSSAHHALPLARRALTLSVGVDSLAVVERSCPLCGGSDAAPKWTASDRAFGVPGRYTVVRCNTCAFLYQNPRVDDSCLRACYPDNYPRHQEPSPRIPLKGSEPRKRVVRWVLAKRLGYPFATESADWLTRLRAAVLSRRLTWDCPPWIPPGRHLDVGCGSGSTLALTRSLGWTTCGIEVAAAAAQQARRFADEIYDGDALSAPIAPGRFDLVTALHVVEHVADPVALLDRMLSWLAPGGLLICEVPNAAGLGAQTFGPAWPSLELPRHLSQFSPESLRRAVEQAGGRVLWLKHRSKPRDYIRGLRLLLSDHGWPRVAAAIEKPFVRGCLKLLLELFVPLAASARRGEVIRIGVVAR